MFQASAGIAQPLLGLSLALTGGATPEHEPHICGAAYGLLSDGTLGPAATITLMPRAVSPQMDAELAGLTYTGTGMADTLTFTSNRAL